MRIRTPFLALGGAAAAAMLAACTGGSAISPAPTTAQDVGPSKHGPTDRMIVGPRHHLAGFYSCPRQGSIEYVSDMELSAIYVYVGIFAGQAPCGELTSGIYAPIDLFVDPSTHDLYVANSGDENVLVFHKGQTASYNSYKDPSSQQVLSVAIAKDGTVIATNHQSNIGQENGSISTWHPGPNGGTFVGNFPMTNDDRGGGFALKRGYVYYSDLDATLVAGTIWKVSCPAGVCGHEKMIPGITFVNEAFSMIFPDATELLVADPNGPDLDTFELPNPQPSKSQLSPPIGEGIALDNLHHHLFDVTSDNSAAEYSYPGMALIGTVPGFPRGELFGIAVDPN